MDAEHLTRSITTPTARCSPCRPDDVALHRRAAQVVASSTLADERMLRCGFWWLRPRLLAAYTMLCCRWGWAWTDDRAEAVAILHPPKRARRAKVACPVAQRLPYAALLLVVMVAAAMPAFLVLGVMDVAISLLATPLVGEVTMLAVVLGVVAFGGLAQVGCRRLARTKPPDAYLISNFARATQAEPGRGSLLLRALSHHADERSLTLALHAGPTRLVRYYQEHGFVVTGQARMPWGETTHLMIRTSAETQLGGTS